jgi:hypothetical protein
MNNFSALGSQFSHRPGHPTQQADYCANFGVRFSRVLAPSLASDLVPHAYCLHCPSLPRLEQPVVRRTVDFTAWRSVPDHPPRHLRASAASRRRRHAASPPRTPPRSLLSAGVCHCGRHRERGGAAIGVSRSTLTGSLSAAAAMVGAEPSNSAAAAAAAAAVGPLAAARAARRRRRAVGASRREAAADRATAVREAAGAAEARAGACATTMKVQRARARVCLLM